MKHFFSCDWGTSNFRLKLIDTNHQEIIDEIVTAEGIAAVHSQWKLSHQSRETFYGAILQKNVTALQERLLLDCRGAPIILSGMASSSLGMRELPYASLPFEADGSSVTSATIIIDGLTHPIHLISGVRSVNDVMRGEETQWIGLMQELCFPDKTDVLFILPGTHSKHIRTGDGRITGFDTFMTGEFYNLLASHSVLQNSIEMSSPFEKDDDENAFLQGVHTASGNNILHTSFLVRTNELFGNMNKKQNGFFLSGLLIGSELQHVNADRIVLAAGRSLVQPYRLALQQIVPAERLTVLAAKTIESAAVRGQFEIFKEKICAL
jgi:2-dehydro-3-deoxygalactonokinase